MLIGLSGYAGSGKDTVGARLVNKYDFERRAWADKLREVLYNLNPYVSSHKRVQDLVPVGCFDSESWGQAKEWKEVRELLQRLGTEAGRDTLWPDIWVDATMRSMDVDTSYVITDCRFPNEAAAIVASGGYLVRVNRPGFGPINGHSSETSLDYYTFDFVLDNEGTVEDLEDMVDDLVAGIRHDEDWKNLG